MATEFHCPYCDAILNVGGDVILTGSTGRSRGLFLLSPDLGNYRVMVPRDLRLGEGEAVDFACPVCAIQLTSPFDRNLAEVHAIDGEGHRLRVEFSRLHGEHATFLVGDQSVQTFGEHAPNYANVNFFGATF